MCVSVGVCPFSLVQTFIVQQEEILFAAMQTICDNLFNLNVSINWMKLNESGWVVSCSFI